MKQIKVELSPREWAEKRLQLYCSFSHQPSVEILDKAIETCGFVLKEQANVPVNPWTLTVLDSKKANESTERPHE